MKSGGKYKKLVLLAAVLLCGMSAHNTGWTEKSEAAESSVENGIYQMEVTLEGGSGRAGISSPAQIKAENGTVTAAIVWSSPYYDYMLVDGERYDPVNTEGNSVFEIPVKAFDCEIQVVADTVAMSTPHEIAYTLYFDSATLTNAVDFPEAEAETETEEEKETENQILQDETTEEDWCGLTWDHRLPLSYAQQFQIDFYEGEYARIQIKDADTFLVVPEDQPVPDGLEKDVIVLQQPIENAYLVATSAMDLICSVGAIDQIALSGTAADGWYVEQAKAAMEEGSIQYAGKYSAPDYEQILVSGCDLAIESTMIYHSPDVKEKLESFGIPVLVEHSSYETHPMGRSEWMKLYGVLFGCEETAQQVFEEQQQQMEAVAALDNTEKTVAFFYISSNGYANVRKPSDYVAQMIELGGGKYVFADLDDENALSTINMTLEEFYAAAKDADFIIYNSTIDAELHSIDELLGKSALLADFKAVQNGNVWCTGKNLFQETTSLGAMIADIHKMLTSDEEALADLTYFHKLQ